MTPKEMIQILEENGFFYVKCGSRSHRKFKNFSTRSTTKVLVHSREYSRTSGFNKGSPISLSLFHVCV